MSIGFEKFFGYFEFSLFSFPIFTSFHFTYFFTFYFFILFSSLLHSFFYIISIFSFIFLTIIIRPKQNNTPALFTHGAACHISPSKPFSLNASLFFQSWHSPRRCAIILLYVAFTIYPQCSPILYKPFTKIQLFLFLYKIIIYYFILT